MIAHRNSLRPLRLAFLASAAWQAFAGLTLLFPALASQVFSMQIVNTGLASEFGGVMLTLGLISYVCASDPRRYGTLWLPYALGAGLNAAINLFYLLNGHYTLGSAIFQLVLMPVLSVWFWLSRPRV